jgi:N-acetylglucosaminyl-diphospho-decaprenol L-rhamnosyltransferase
MGAAAQHRPRVTVAVVSFNTRELLIRCLRSLAGEVEPGGAEVWVVDNGSDDGSPQAARDHAPWARLLQPENNLGFGRAVNLVARHTRSEWLACANADVALEPGALTALLDAGADQRVGCVAPRLVLPDGSTQSSLHSLPTIPFTLALNLGLYRLGAGIADRLLIPGRYDLERPRDAPWAVGAFLLVRRSAFDDVGGFDERQWMYAEDLDLGWRLRQAGWRTRYEPRARVLHASAAATEPAFGPDRVPRFMRATYAVIVRRRGIGLAWVTATINVLGAAVRVAWMRPLAKVAPRLRASMAENRMWLKAHFQGLRPRSALLEERAVQPPVPIQGMRSFWNARAREDALYFVDTRQRYGAADGERFWDGEQLLHVVLDGLGVAVSDTDTVVEIGCGVGRITRALAARARTVIALDVSDEMLRRARQFNPELGNVEWVLGDGVSLRGVADVSVDACVSLVVFQHLPDPALALGYVREVGRVLRPGGWAALQISNDPSVHRPRARLFAHGKALVGLAPKGQRHPAWLGCAVELPALAATAGQSELELEKVWGEGTQYCQVLLRKRLGAAAAGSRA